MGRELLRGDGVWESTQRSGWEEGRGGGSEWLPSAVESRPLQRTPRPALALHCANSASVPCHARHTLQQQPARVVCSAHSTCSASFARHFSPASATLVPDARTDPAAPAMPAAPAAPAAPASCPASGGAVAHDDVFPGRVRRRRSACLTLSAVAVASAVASVCVV